MAAAAMAAAVRPAAVATAAGVAIAVATPAAVAPLAATSISPPAAATTAVASAVASTAATSSPAKKAAAGAACGPRSAASSRRPRTSIEIEEKNPPFEGAVHHRKPAPGAQADVFAAVLAAGQDRGLPTLVSLLEDVSQFAPTGRVGAQALAVGRIDQDEAGTGGRLEAAGVAVGEGDAVQKVGLLQVGAGAAEGLGGFVVAVEVDVGPGRGERLLKDGREGCGIVIWEALEGPVAAQAPRRPAQGEPAGLDEQGPGAAHEIHGRAAAVPAGGENAGGGQLPPPPGR